MAMATMLAAVLGLQFGAAGVVAETVLSGVSSLPAQTFVWLMLPIHLAIGGVEGVATVALLRFLQRERPDMLRRDATVAPGPRRRLLGGLAVAALIIGGMGSWFASTQPDGLEWSVARAIGRAESPAPLGAVHTGAATLQQRTAWLPGYTWHTPATGSNAEPAAWPQVDAGTSLAGVLGGVATLALVAAVALLLRRRAAAQPTDVRQG
jgi:cobalt/nickel transport system permease protein